MEIHRQRRADAQVVVVRTDGSAPENALGPQLVKGTRVPASLALSPDERTLYATGMLNSIYLGVGKYRNTVYRFGWSDKQATPFITAGLNSPRSVAVDKDGNLYVADHGNDRIAVFKADGSPLGELAVDKPERVEVHPKTGAVYVLGGPRVDRLQAFASWKMAQPRATAVLPHFKHRFYTALIALDASSDPPVLWAGSYQGSYARFGLLRIEDKGDAFAEPTDITKLPRNRKPTARKPTQMTLWRGGLYVWDAGGPVSAWNAATGAPLTIGPMPGRRQSGLGFVIHGGRDGNFYWLGGYPDAWLARYDSRLKPLPFAAATGKDGTIPNLGSPRTHMRGMCTDYKGNVYVLRQKPAPASRQRLGPLADANAVAVFSPEGKVVHDKLIDSDIRNLNSIRVDPAGNMYLAVGLHPGTDALPPHLKGRLPEGRRDPDADCGHNYYPLMYGSIVKFGPAGGQIRRKGDGQPAIFAYNRKLVVKGARWMFFGASVVPAWLHGDHFRPDLCQCESPRMDVDGFGRCFFPDACGFRVGVLDTGGNLICWFGRYGNQDSAGPGRRIPTPEIPIGWVHAVAVDDGAAFVGDWLNQRVMRVRLEYAAEQTCDLK
jgi:sugar lactone lactonase YvrE